ncbi:MAG: hypothetical protein ABL898_05270 [Hyphomicrobiaceae bacterium]|nr:hypothetical protein [Hyphomicrobiaceae bacterium]
MRKLNAVAIAANLTLLATTATAALADARTIRIEPRPYTSVIVTMENGVRVWRPMPPTELVIVNPGNKASINLEVDAKGRRTENHNSFSHGN